MPKVSVYKVSKGEKTLLSENEVSSDKIDEIRTRIPEINLEILGYANSHTKEQVLIKYPKHKYFVESIVFN